jgi:hypothetical protein
MIEMEENPNDNTPKIKSEKPLAILSSKMGIFRKEDDAQTTALKIIIPKPIGDSSLKDNPAPSNNSQDDKGKEEVDKLQISPRNKK